MEWLELYKGESLTYYGKVDLVPVLMSALSSELGSLLHRSRVTIVPNTLRDRQTMGGRPYLVNLRADVGHLTVLVEKDGRRRFQHPYSVSDLLGPTLRAYLLNLDAQEDYWGFCLASPALDGFPKTRPAPEVAGMMSVDTTEDQPIPFRVLRVEEEQPPLLDVAALGIDPAELRGVNVLLSAESYALMSSQMQLSDTVEEGGFLTGTVHRPVGAENSYVIQVRRVIRASHSGASMMQFTFTGDSFREMNRVLAERAGETLLGWFHTHLFPATHQLGLSATDVSLHLSTFQRSFQVAGLINISGDERIVRFYTRYAETMELCPQWIENERGGYRATRADLGA
jgi:hypothetical protein